MNILKLMIFLGRLEIEDVFWGGGWFSDIWNWQMVYIFYIYSVWDPRKKCFWNMRTEIWRWSIYRKVRTLWKCGCFRLFWRFLESTVQENEGPHRLTRDGDGEQRFENVLVQERNKSLNVPDNHCLTHVTCFNFTSFGGWFQFFSKNISCSVHHSHFYEPVDYY